MNRSQIALLLTAIAGRDQRTIGDADVLAWHQDLGDLGYDDALAAVTRHFRDSIDRIMPAHIRRIVRIIHDEQRAHSVVAELPPGRFDQDPDRDARLARNVSKIRELLDEIAQKRSIPGDDSAHTRALLRARREKGRPERPAKQPRRDARPQAEPDPVDEQIATLAKHYLRDGWSADRVAERLGISRKWCRKTARRLAPLGPVGWCGKCTYDGRMRKAGPNQEPTPCPDCHSKEAS